jgi:hypothetical protein
MRIAMASSGVARPAGCFTSSPLLRGEPKYDYIEQMLMRQPLLAFR